MIRALGATLHLTSLGEEHLEEARRTSVSGHVVFAFWHGRQFPLVFAWRKRGVAILTSLSKDGTLQSMVLGGLGYHIVRGSTSRGAVRGLVGMIRTVKAGRDAAFAVDGPRGPFHEVKHGVLYLAARAGIPVVPITSAARRVRVFENAWDRYMLPHPFTRCVVAYGPALVVPSGAEGNELEELAAELSVRIDAATERAETVVSGPV